MTRTVVWTTGAGSSTRLCVVSVAACTIKISKRLRGDYDKKTALIGGAPRAKSKCPKPGGLGAEGGGGRCEGVRGGGPRTVKSVP